MAKSQIITVTSGENYKKSSLCELFQKKKKHF